MQTTGNLNLKKPEGTDIVDINDLNDNMDILDSEVSRVASTTANGRMTAADKAKLNGIAASANNYVHPANHPASIITQDASNRFVTDAEKAAWNAKASSSVATTSANGLMSSGDKSKLDGIAAGANNYVHPANHPASIITQDANNRFASDTEKAAWNAKAGTSVATTSANGLMSSEDKILLANREGYGTTAGTGTAYTVTVSPGPASLVDGLGLAVKIHLQNTGSATININGLGARTIRKSNGNALAAGNLRQNAIYTLRYNGTDFILQGEGGEYGNATSSEVLSGRTIGTESGLVIGTMPDRGTPSIIPRATNQTLQAGRYLGGTVQGDADLIPVNIRNGVNIFGVNGVLNEEKKAQGSALGVPSVLNYDRYYKITVTGLSFSPSVVFARAAAYSISGNLNGAIAAIAPMFFTSGDIQNQYYYNEWTGNFTGWRTFGRYTSIQGVATNQFRLLSDGFEMIVFVDGAGNDPLTPNVQWLAYG